ncbi:DUF1722 domain-containing protein [Acidobacteriota bacterium]
MLILSHSPKHYREMGRVVADGKAEAPKPSVADACRRGKQSP